MQQQNGLKCEISGQPGGLHNMIPLRALSRGIRHRIVKEGHVYDPDGFIHAEALNRMVQRESSNEPVEHLSADELEETYESSLSWGDRVADKIADFGGSWSFILLFIGFITLWITLNMIRLFGPGFDEYPFILLNLILSCVAALQAPVIMMSQNRQEAKDRLRAQNDYYINLKAEKEIRELNKKLDELMGEVRNRK